MFQVGLIIATRVQSSSTDDRLLSGTTRYFDDLERPQIAGENTVGLKCDRTGPVPIILVPQPSDDPNDPLVSTFIP
jgi:hypothetical protein